MSYALAISSTAERDWVVLDESIKRRFKQKLINERLIKPRVPKDALSGFQDHYKIKITSPQYGLAHHVNDEMKLITITGVSSRDFVYDILNKRLKQ